MLKKMVLCKFPNALLAQRTTPNVLCLIKTMHLKALGFHCEIKNACCHHKGEVLCAN